MPKEISQDWLPYSALEIALNDVKNMDRKWQEKSLHACLDTHPVLLYQDQYQAHWSEPRLRNPDPFQKEIRPDFVLKPHDDAFAPWRVMEIKTSESHIMRRGKFTEFFLDAMDQLRRRYADYFDDPRTRGEQRRTFGRPLEKPQFALLIGRQFTPEEHEGLRAAKIKSEWSDVKFVNYDELLDFGISRLNIDLRLAFSIREE